MTMVMGVFDNRTWSFQVDEGAVRGISRLEFKSNYCFLCYLNEKIRILLEILAFAQYKIILWTIWDNRMDVSYG